MIVVVNDANILIDLIKLQLVEAYTWTDGVTYTTSNNTATNVC